MLRTEPHRSGTEQWPEARHHRVGLARGSERMRDLPGAGAAPREGMVWPGKKQQSMVVVETHLFFEIYICLLIVVQWLKTNTELLKFKNFAASPTSTKNQGYQRTKSQTEGDHRS